jgi:hypothetical protein
MAHLSLLSRRFLKGKIKDKEIAVCQAYFSMYEKSYSYWERGFSDEVAIMLSGLSLLPDRRSADYAAMRDYL